MGHKNLGPKTGTFEPPSLNEYRNFLITDISMKIDSKDTKYKNLHSLTKELICAYERNDKEDIERLIKEFNSL